MEVLAGRQKLVYPCKGFYFAYEIVPTSSTVSGLFCLLFIYLFIYLFLDGLWLER